MMLARIRLQPSPDEPAIFALDDLIPLAIAQRFADAFAAQLPDGEVWLIRSSPSAAALLYPDAYAEACATYRSLPAPAVGISPNNKNPQRSNAEGSEELIMEGQSRPHCSADAPPPPVRRAS
ncbi:MAG: hypothetical protein ACI8RZ_007865 [Myxococcota bacterium]|jgi:hypothetical protein